MRMTIRAAAVAVAAATLAAPAAATLVQYRFAGVVAGLVPGGYPDGVVAGDTVAARVRYDPARLVDVTATANALYGAGTYTKLVAAPLGGGAGRLDFNIGLLRFTQDNQLPFPDTLGAGGNPHVLFRDGAFFGVGYFGATPSMAAFSTAGAAPQPFDFVGGNLKFGGPSYFGFFDYAGARFDGAVPEPASWALMLTGFGIAGAALRRRRVMTATC